MKVTISVGKHRREIRWKIKSVEWDKLVEKLSKTARTAESMADYKAASKDRKTEIKDIGGFVGGAVEGGRRVKGSVRLRSLLTLDLDYAEQGVWEDIIMTYSCAMCMYSTHSHTPETPRYRLVIPLSRDVSADEYEAIARKVAEHIGIDMFDDTTYQTERLMFWASTSRDGEFVFEHQSGEPLNADEVLTEYHDWRDVSQWAVSSRVDALVLRQMQKKGDPLEKKGLLGAFCRAYTISEAITTFLTDYYTPVANMEGRYTYTGGTSAAGLVVYDDKFAYSHHATDPCSGVMCNAFDLVRIHLFGNLDEGKADDTPINRLPSNKEMEAFIREDTDVKAELGSEAVQRLHEDFGDLYSDEPDTDDDSWMTNLSRDTKGVIESTADNILLILENAKGLKGNLRRNDFTHTDEILHDLPWRKVRFPRDKKWNNDDEARLRVYLERYYKIRGRELIIACFTEVTTAHSYHPVRDYLASLQWDGTLRAETLLIDYLGAEDNQLTRSVTRKFLTAAVARVYDPGVKFDYVTVLQGREGIGKSTLLSRLASQAWFNDSMTDLNGKEAMEMLQGSWIIEIGELQAIKRSEIENVKAFLSRQVDAFRPAYGRVREEHPRQCVFFATTNEENFLKGADGNRRFWTITCNGDARYSIFSMDAETRNQIWAEAVHFYSEGEQLYLEDNLSEQRMREIQAKHNEDALDIRVGMIEEYLDKMLPADWNTMTSDARVVYLADEDAIESRGVAKRTKVCVAEIMVECFHERIDERNKYKVKEYNNLMKRISGWERASSTMRIAGYGIQRGYVRIGV